MKSAATFAFGLLIVAPAMPLRAQEKQDDQDPFVRYNAGLDREASKAFSDAVQRNAEGVAMPAELAEAQMRLDRRIRILTAQAGEQIKNGEIPAALRAAQDSPDSRAVAQKLERDIAGLRIDPGPDEYGQLAESTVKATGNLNAAGVESSLQVKALMIRQEVENAVEDEFAGTIDALEKASAPPPGSEAPQ